MSCQRCKSYRLIYAMLSQFTYQDECVFLYFKIDSKIATRLDVMTYKVRMCLGCMEEVRLKYKETFSLLFLLMRLNENSRARKHPMLHLIKNACLFRFCDLIYDCHIYITEWDLFFSDCKIDFISNQRAASSD